MKLKDNFIIGAASSSYQIEGAADEDGKEKSIWDTFCEIPGKIHENENGKIACDSYHKYKDDVSCAEKIGLQAYRFSMSWGRMIQPITGKINEKGMRYYEKLIDLLLEKHIEPYVTLYHWDLPQCLEDNGGWENRDTSYAFEAYAKAVAKRFAGKVKHYFTINEPQCIIQMGYHSGKNAPGKQLDEERCMVCAHNLMLAHGLAVRALRKYAGENVEIGLASTGVLAFPQKNTPANIKISYQLSFLTNYQGIIPFSFFSHAVFLDPILLGHYPSDLPDNLKKVVDGFPSDDMNIIHERLDMLGVNIYNGIEVNEKGMYIPRYQGFPRTSVNWPVTPEVMKWGLRHLYRRYQLPLIISENGQSCNDRIYEDGKVHDLDRIDTLSRYLKSTMEAIDEGTDVRGYFHWALTDNFEWSEGYDPRFGFVFIDYNNDNARIIKDSGRWIHDVIKDKEITNIGAFLAKYNTYFSQMF